MTSAKLATGFGTGFETVRAWRDRNAFSGALQAALAGTLVAGLGFANGGYFPTSWSWTSSALLALLVIIFVAGAPSRPTRLETAYLAAIASVFVWTALSIAWSPTATSSVYEVERTLLYLVAVGAFPFAFRSISQRALLGGVLIGIALVTLYALATRLLPDRVGAHSDAVAGYRLAHPIGYWNGLALLAAMGLLLAVGFATRSRFLTRALAGALIPWLGVALYFTFSRGGWLALAVGLAVLLVADPKRLGVITASAALAVWPAVAIWRASSYPALNRTTARAADATVQGHRLALLVLLLSLAGAATAVLIGWLERSVVVPIGLRLGYAAALVLVVVAASAGVVVHFGGPQELGHRVRAAVASQPKKNGGDLRKRVFDLSSNGRLQLWHVAIADFKAHPLAGSGAGTFERYWARDRTVGFSAKDGHSLYLETLAELGLPGLILLVIMLGVPLVALVRRRTRTAAVAGAAYAAYLVEAAVDWDWELAAVTLPALLCGLVLVRTSGRSATLGAPLRVAATLVAASLCALVLVTAVGNTALQRSQNNLNASRWATAAKSARRALSWNPWSTDARQALGEAQLGTGNVSAANATTRRALRDDPGNWQLWLDLALATTGPARREAIQNVAQLNPLSKELQQLRAAR